jgi:FKBP12-rapamycin complex-associated protein
LNKIAQILINRITQKLTGMDFNNDKPFDIKEQINILINQATSNENLAQSYLGWYPFW